MLMWRASVVFNCRAALMLWSSAAEKVRIARLVARGIGVGEVGRQHFHAARSVEQRGFVHTQDRFHRQCSARGTAPQNAFSNYRAMRPSRAVARFAVRVAGLQRRFFAARKRLERRTIAGSFRRVREVRRAMGARRRWRSR